jgi:hypothetical protein
MVLAHRLAPGRGVIERFAFGPGAAVVLRLIMVCS